MLHRCEHFFHPARFRIPYLSEPRSRFRFAPCPVRPNKSAHNWKCTSQAFDKAMTVLRSRKRRSERDAWLPFAGTPTKTAEASIVLIMRRLERLSLAAARRFFRFGFVVPLVFGRGLRLVFDFFPRHYGCRIMCVDGHCCAGIRAWDKRHACAFFLEIVACDGARLLIAPKPL